MPDAYPCLYLVVGCAARCKADDCAVNANIGDD